MKRSTAFIVKEFPFLKKHLSDGDLKGTDDVLASLSNVEKTFLQLACFYEDPDHSSFNLAMVYQNLDNDWLEVALESLYIFFSEDTYLLKDPTFSIMREGGEYMNQVQFADYLKENGLNYDRRKLNVYVKRGVLPAADLTVAGTKYWERATCEAFLQQERKKMPYSSSQSL
ncbi:hypothetical protein ACE1TI_17990 [Alteribacillus sp. JSM 102045]|uniref:hypothetical protein n=1 Tax=Alteribacillus sp. JSM 102045 TaxID=1562101 RepID=UPI0035C1167B